MEKVTIPYREDEGVEGHRGYDVVSEDSELVKVLSRGGLEV